MFKKGDLAEYSGRPWVPHQSRGLTRWNKHLCPGDIVVILELYHCFEDSNSKQGEYFVHVQRTSKNFRVPKRYFDKVSK